MQGICMSMKIRSKGGLSSRGPFIDPSVVKASTASLPLATARTTAPPLRKRKETSCWLSIASSTRRMRFPSSGRAAVSITETEAAFFEWPLAWLARIISTPGNGPVARLRVKVLPLSGTLSTVMVPPSNPARRWLMRSPNPVPPYRRFVLESPCANAAKSLLF